MNQRSQGHLLADEHAILLQQVEAHEDRILTVLRDGRWPRRELRELVDYLRYELLDQAAHEERLLFPLATGGFGSAQVEVLMRDHVALRDAADRLAREIDAEIGEQDGNRLAEFLLDLRQQLDRHLAREERALATTTLEGIEPRRRPTWSRTWYPLTEGPVLDLDVLPVGFATRVAMQRLARLSADETVEVRSHSAPTVLSALVADRWGADYGWTYLEEGPQRWRAEVTRRRPQ
ncbi:DUF2249 domain-containing protein [Geodermatophilus sp. DF01-2]|uniref:hemerythrin domain-containing protein n=1 Tax=Geodermatophilus sp. DF01-2 TaxID=2559610 RepID=UPI0010732829|nr:hemerythrin domain-containing protein [Geodermatophilus sp. DF01_2]TFV63945.1 DUF2249 domain-containing protein [Geodermatophilus sp. DF01_2]